MGIKERLLVFVNSLGVSRSEFERNSCLSNGYINNIREGMGADKVENVLRAYPQLNRNWLLTGNGEMLNPAYSNNKITMNGNENVSNIGGQHISILLPKNGTRKIINPDGTVEVQSIGKNIYNSTNTDKFIELLKKKDEQIDRLITLLEKR